MSQVTFSDVEYSNRKHKTKREEFLDTEVRNFRGDLFSVSLIFLRLLPTSATAEHYAVSTNGYRVVLLIYYILPLYP